MDKENSTMLRQFKKRLLQAVASDMQAKFMSRAQWQEEIARRMKVDQDA